MDIPRVVSSGEWVPARKDLLAKEKDATHAKDAVDAARRELPMTQVTKDYIFTGAAGPATLAGLFEGRRQLITYHFMWRHADSGFPAEDQGCPTCSFLVDSIGDLSHLHACDTTLVLVSRAPVDSIERFRKRMGWQLPWYSSAGSDFNYDSTSALTRAGFRWSTTTRTRKPWSARLPTSAPAQTDRGSACSGARATRSSTPTPPTSAGWTLCSAPTGGLN
jgi:predicted dithiol-disulfide oxidoreductase (DUF899 family)